MIYRDNVRPSGAPCEHCGEYVAILSSIGDSPRMCGHCLNKPHPWPERYRHEVARRAMFYGIGAFAAGVVAVTIMSWWVNQ